MKVSLIKMLELFLIFLFFPILFTITPWGTINTKASPDSFNFFLIGDFGDITVPKISGSYPFELVLKQMNERANKIDIQRIVTVGDNFYANSQEELIYVASKVLSKAFSYPNLNETDWILTYGNHEAYFDSQLEKFVEENFFKIVMKTGVWTEVLNMIDYKIAFFYLPPQISCCGNLNNKVYLKQCKRMMANRNFSELLDLVEMEFKAQVDDEKVFWRIVVLHYPLFSMSAHGMDNENLKFYLLPLLQKYKIDLVLTGHHHNMQYLTYKIKTEYKKQTFKKKCLKEAKIKCGDQLKSCYVKSVKCEEFNITCADRIPLHNNKLLQVQSTKFISFIQGDHIHHVIQGAGGSFLDPFCKSASNSMAQYLFGKAEFGFSEVTINENFMSIKFFILGGKKPEIESRILHKIS